MPTLPQDIDYGQRPSLQTNRMDRPGTGSLGSAEALVLATEQFGRELEQRKQKNDALNYALARNEIQQADLLQRDSLAEDLDWKTHDKRYSEGFGSKSEEISRKYNLDPSDRALLESETRLIGARGRVAVGANANKLKVGESLASLQKGIADARESIINADPGTRNHIMLGTLEAIDAARDSGALTPVEADSLRQRTTQDFAKASIDAMPADERKSVLEATMAYRRKGGDLSTNTGQGPLTPEDIAAGNGTGSIADFLHTDTVAAMLKVANDEDKENQNRIEAYAVMDRAKAMFPEDEVAALKYISQNAKGTIRDIAEREASEHFNRMKAAEAEVAQRIVDDYGTGILDGTQRYNTIPSELKAKLGVGQKKALQSLQDEYDQVAGFARVTQIIDTKDGRGSLDMWNDLPNYSDGSPLESKATINLDSPMWRQSLSPRDHQEMKAAQAALIASETAPVSDNGITPRQMATRALAGFEAGSKLEKDGMVARLTWEIDAAIIAKQHSFKPARKLTYQEELEIVSQLMSRKAFVKEKTLFLDFLDPDSEIDVSTATDEQLNKAYLPIERAKEEFTRIGGQENSVYDVLVQQARDAGVDDPDENDLARAYFALKSGLGTAEVLRRLKGE